MSSPSQGAARRKSREEAIAAALQQIKDVELEQLEDDKREQAEEHKRRVAAITARCNLATAAEVRGEQTPLLKTISKDSEGKQSVWDVVEDVPKGEGSEGVVRTPKRKGEKEVFHLTKEGVEKVISPYMKGPFLLTPKSSTDVLMTSPTKSAAKKDVLMTSPPKPATKKDVLMTPPAKSVAKTLIGSKEPMIESEEHPSKDIEVRLEKVKPMTDDEKLKFHSKKFTSEETWKAAQAVHVLGAKMVKDVATNVTGMEKKSKKPVGTPAKTLSKSPVKAVAKSPMVKLFGEKVISLSSDSDGDVSETGSLKLVKSKKTAVSKDKDCKTRRRLSSVGDKMDGIEVHGVAGRPYDYWFRPVVPKDVFTSKLQEGGSVGSGVPKSPGIEDMEKTQQAIDDLITLNKGEELVKYDPIAMRIRDSMVAKRMEVHRRSGLSDKILSDIYIETLAEVESEMEFEVFECKSVWPVVGEFQDTFEEMVEQGVIKGRFRKRIITKIGRAEDQLRRRAFTDDSDPAGFSPEHKLKVADSEVSMVSAQSLGLEGAQEDSYDTAGEMSRSESMNKRSGPPIVKKILKTDVVVKCYDARKAILQSGIKQKFPKMPPFSLLVECKELKGVLESTQQNLKDFLESPAENMRDERIRQSIIAGQKQIIKESSTVAVQSYKAPPFRRANLPALREISELSSPLSSPVCASDSGFAASPSVDSSGILVSSVDTSGSIQVKGLQVGVLEDAEAGSDEEEISRGSTLETVITDGISLIDDVFTTELERSGCDISDLQVIILNGSVVKDFKVKDFGDFGDELSDSSSVLSDAKGRFSPRDMQTYELLTGYEHEYPDECDPAHFGSEFVLKNRYLEQKEQRVSMWFLRKEVRGVYFGKGFEVIQSFRKHGWGFSIAEYTEWREFIQEKVLTFSWLPKYEGDVNLGVCVGALQNCGIPADWTRSLVAWEALCAGVVTNATFDLVVRLVMGCHVREGSEGNMAAIMRWMSNKCCLLTLLGHALQCIYLHVDEDMCESYRLWADLFQNEVRSFCRNCRKFALDSGLDTYIDSRLKSLREVCAGFSCQAAFRAAYQLDFITPEVGAPVDGKWGDAKRAERDLCHYADKRPDLKSFIIQSVKTMTATTHLKLLTMQNTGRLKKFTVANVVKIQLTGAGDLIGAVLKSPNVKEIRVLDASPIDRMGIDRKSMLTQASIDIANDLRAGEIPAKGFKELYIEMIRSVATSKGCHADDVICSTVSKFHDQRLVKQVLDEMAGEPRDENGFLHRWPQGTWWYADGCVYPQREMRNHREGVVDSDGELRQKFTDEIYTDRLGYYQGRSSVNYGVIRRGHKRDAERRESGKSSHSGTQDPYKKGDLEDGNRSRFGSGAEYSSDWKSANNWTDRKEGGGDEWSRRKRDRESDPDGSPVKTDAKKVRLSEESTFTEQDLQHDREMHRMKQAIELEQMRKTLRELKAQNEAADGGGNNEGTPN